MDLPQFQVHAAIESRHWWFLARRKIFRALLCHIVPPHQGKKLLDVGCGTGGNTAAFSHDYDCLGIDPIPEAIAFAKQRFPACRFIVGEASKDVRREMREADIILLADVLEHVEEDRALVANLIHAMKPGAVLLAMAPADMRLWSPHDRGFGHFRRYDLAGFCALFHGLPATKLLCSYVNTRLYWPIRCARVLARLTGKSLGPSDTDLLLPPGPMNAVLRKIFEGESKRLLALLEGKRVRTYRRGVSVLALLRKV